MRRVVALLALAVAALGCASRVAISPYGYRLEQARRLDTSGQGAGRQAPTQLAVYFSADNDLSYMASQKKIDRLLCWLRACSHQSKGHWILASELEDVLESEHDLAFTGGTASQKPLYKVLLPTRVPKHHGHVGLEETLQAAKDNGLCIRVSGGRWPFGASIKSNDMPIAANLVGEVRVEAYALVSDVVVTVDCQEVRNGTGLLCEGDELPN